MANRWSNKTLAIILSVILCMALVPATSLSQIRIASASTIKYISTAEEFMTALSSASAGDVIDLQGKEITTPQQSDDTPLVNNASITIQNAKISLSHAGIVLGAPLTLKDVQLTFRNTIRNGIFANGHSLELENVTRLGGNELNIHVVLGQIINSSNAGNSAGSSIPARGYNQQVTIKGNNDLGKIILGQFDDSSNGEAQSAIWYYSGTTLNIDSSCTKISDTAANRVVYACGAYESRGQGNADEIVPVSNKYCVSSMNQIINLYGSTINTVYGETGANNKVIVNYNGSSNLTDSVTLDTIRSLYVKSGAFKIKSNGAGSILAGAQQGLGVDAGATLIAGVLGDTTVYNFNGGGTLALGKSSDLKQTLSVTKDVVGTTNVVFGDTMNFFHLNTPITDYVYINAPNSSANSFTSSGGSSGTIWTRNESGGWLWSSSGATEHEHSYEWQSISDDEHAFVCQDPGCPDEDRGQFNEEAHDYESDTQRVCPTCGYQRIIINDIFTPKDDTKYEQFQARLYNKLLHCESNIDVSDIKIKPEDIVYTSNNGQTFAAGATSVYAMIRFHSLFSTNCTTGQPVLELNDDGTIKTVNVTYSQYTWSKRIVSDFEENYEKAMSSISGLSDEFQIALTLHEWLCDHVNYGLNVQFSDFALGAIKNGAAVCAGYSYAYQFLCEQAGLDCKYVAGNTVNLLSGSQEIISHAWNKVKIQGYWFWVDTTWDGSQATTGHSFCLLNDEEWKSAGSGGHANDVITQTNEPPANNNAYFANKFWEGKTGVLSASEIAQDPKLTVNCDHVWDEGTVTTEPTCTQTGEKTFKCSACGLTRTEVVEAKGHTLEVMEGKSPTCTEAGYTSYQKCSTCGQEEGKEDLAALGHLYDESGQCTRCGHKQLSSVKINLSDNNKNDDITFDKSEYGLGESATVTIKGKVIGNNFRLPKTVKVNGVVVTTSESLINKGAWVKENGEYKRRMNEDATSVEFDSIAQNLTSTTSIAINLLSNSLEVEVEFEELLPVYRLYNSITSEHMFTTNKSEYDNFVQLCKSDQDFWIGEGINWFAPSTSETVVRRLYNSALGALGHSSHYYTSDANEIDNLVNNYGWQDDGAANQFTSGGEIAIWTCYNEALGSAHHYTSNKSEWSGLQVHGWDLEEAKNGASGVFSAAMSAF